MSLDTNAKLDMSLDDIANQERRGGRGSPGSKRARGGSSTGVDEERAVASVAKRVYVGNLSWKVSWQDLKDHFRTAGNVVYADVMRSPVDDRSKGCGIVEFETSEEAAQAIRTLNQTELQERPIFVREDREDRDVTGRNKRARGTGRGFNNYNNNFNGNGGQVVLGRKVYVAGLPNDASWQDLKDHFRQANANVLFCDVAHNNQGKAYGIVELASAQEALRCITALSNTSINGKNIFVREYREQGAAGGGGGFNQNANPGGSSGGSFGGAGCQVVVHGLPWSYTWQMLKDWFREAGAVGRADIVTDQQGRSRGYGTVSFQSASDAQNAIDIFNGTQLEGRIIAVKLDKFA